jgi:hypothetical protein
MIEEYISSVKKQFKLNCQFNQESNSITNIVKHLSGNMLSRWTDFLTTDGEKEFRNRDEEFRPTTLNKQGMLMTWNKGWVCLFNALETITAENFSTILYIRNQGHTIMEAINRQVAHYAYHVGQIVFIGKMILNDDWKSLSIPKGSSENYNVDKFSEPKATTHFTDEFLSQDKE